MLSKRFIKALLISNVILSSGCATVGSKLDLQLAQEAETKGCEDTYQNKGISLEDCKLISEVIKEMTIDGATGKYGFAGYDSEGKIKLKGSYKNEEEISKAFMVAATVVGVDKVGISDVTPREIGQIKMSKSYVIPKETVSKPKKYALLIGISRFKDNKIHPIESAGKDADLLADILEQKNGYNDENITVIKDEDATKSNILAAMRDLASKVTSKDTVIFYISTHGTPPNMYGKMGVLPFDTKPSFDAIDFKSIEGKTGDGRAKTEQKDKQSIMRIAAHRAETIESAISFDDLQNFMTSIRTSKFIAILDTCFSGSALETLTKPIKIEYAAATQNFVSNYSDANKKSLIDGTAQLCESSDYEASKVKDALDEAFNRYKSIKTTQVNIGTKGMFTESTETNESNNFKLNKNTSNNNNFEQIEKFKSTFPEKRYEISQARILLTATNGNQQSLFDDPKEFERHKKEHQLNREIIDNSFFTHFLAQGLEKNHGKLFQSFDYAQIRTKLLTAKDYGREQTPQMTSTPDACANINVSQ